MGKMQEEIKALRRQNTHLQNVVQRQRQHLSELTGAIQDYRKAITAHYVACAITFGIAPMTYTPRSLSNHTSPV